MSARSFGEIVANAKAEKAFRSNAPVWRNSYYEGQIEHQIWRPIADGKKRGAKRHIGAVMKSARALERRTRRERQKVHPGTRNGVLGQIGLDVLEALYELVEFATGRLDPAVATISDIVGHSYAAVHAALRRLRAAGFLQWVRRSRPKENPDPFGPQVEQISNAYCLLVPEKIAHLVGWLLGKAPVPDDAAWQADDRKRQWQEMLNTLNHSEFLRDTWSGNELAGETLKRIAALLDKRESSRA